MDIVKGMFEQQVMYQFALVKTNGMFYDKKVNGFSISTVGQSKTAAKVPGTKDTKKYFLTYILEITFHFLLFFCSARHK
jgi:ABC-type uncharacterized transport system permease subunit